MTYSNETQDRLICDSSDTWSNRRAQPRLQLLQAIQFTCAGKLLIGEIHDLCQSGLRLRVSRQLPPGARIKLAIPVPGVETGPVGETSPASVIARVAWQQGFFAGLQFVKMDHAHQDALGRWIAGELKRTQASANTANASRFAP